MKGMKLIALVPLVPLLLGGGYLVGGGADGSAALPFVSAESEGDVAEVTEPEPEHHVNLSTGQRVVTLADTHVLRYLKTEVVLEMKSDKPAKGEEYKKAKDELAKELAPVMPAIEDAITTVLASKSALEAASPGGKEALKAELMAQLNGLPIGHTVTNVYFTQFIIQ